MSAAAPWESDAPVSASQPWLQDAAVPVTGENEGDNEGGDEVASETGAAETALHAGSSVVAGLGGGLTYLGTLAATGGDTEAAADVQKSTQAALTYQPRGQQGKGTTEAIGGAVDPIAKKATELADTAGAGTAEETHSPLLGAIERTGLSAIPMLIGGGAARTGLKYERLPGFEDGGIYNPAPAPSGAGPFTRADFEPKALPAPAAAPAAQAPPAAVPVPGKPHIRPKAAALGVTGAAGAPVVDSAAGAPAAATPSAAPDHAGNPAPDVHDPGFFPAPDNQGLKSGTVSAREQGARQGAVERGAPTLPQVRVSAITNNYNDQGRDWTGRQAGDPVAVAQTATENQALHSEAGRISGDTGGQIGTGESADAVRGKAYQDWHDTTVDALQGHIRAAYAAEDASAKQIASPGSNLKGALGDDSLIDSANAGSVRSSTIALGKKMGVDLTDPNAQMNAYQIEQLRKHANSVYPNAPRFAQAVKNAADADLPPGAYARARSLQKLKSQMFDNTDGINQLGASKDINPDTGNPRPENRPVKAPAVMGKIESMDPGQVKHIISTMKGSSTVLAHLGDDAAAASVTDKALKAAQQLQSHFTERWIDEAGKGGGWNPRRSNQFLRNNQETLAGVMSPEQMHQIRNVNNAANVLDLDKGYKGAFAQFSSGAGWVRKRLGAAAIGALEGGVALATHGASEAASAVADMATGGAVQGLRNKIIGGTPRPPKNFTRPIGPGAKMRGGPGGKTGPNIFERLRNATAPYHENPGFPSEADFDKAHGVTMEGDTVTHKSAQRDVTHHVNEDGDHVFQSGPSSITGHNTPDGGIQIHGSATPGAKSEGYGTSVYRAAADHALGNGGPLHSDAVVSGDATRRWNGLKNEGYTRTDNPTNKPTKNGGVISDNGQPAFTITGKNEPAQTTPLGQRLTGGSQRGGPRAVPKDEAPLAGAPEGDRPNGVARRAAAAYAKSAGIDRQPLTDYRYVQPEVAKGVADAYDAMKHDPTNPKVAAAYTAFKAETLAQYKQAVKSGLKVSLDKDYPYKAPRDVQDDVRNNKHMSIFPTEQGFGEKGAIASDHPVLEKSPVQMGGKDATYNDLFRAVHDYYGHVAEGNGFRANGEYNAWRSHRTMYSDAAKPAMDAETLGQNSWVNNQPKNVGASQTATTYAEQKAGLLPPKVVAAAEKGVGADQHHVTNLLTDQERGQLRTDTTQRLMDAFHGTPATEEYAAAALAGSAKRGWYRNSAQAIANTFGPDAPRFSALLSSMSPQVSVQTNFSNALKTFVNWDKAGRPQDAAAIRQIMEDSSQKSAANKGNSNVLDAWVNNGVRSLTSADPTNVQLSGPKVHSFYNNLNGHVNEVTNDAWMAAFAKIDPKALGGVLNKSGPGKSASYMALSAKVRDAAKTLTHLTGETWTPAEVQETVWSWAKTAYEHAEELGDRSIPELVKNGDITDDLIKSTPDFHQLFSAPEHRGFLQSSRYAGNAERVEAAGSNAAAPSKASKAAAKTLRPHLEAAAKRLESVRQERNAVGTEEAPF